MISRLRKLVSLSCLFSLLGVFDGQSAQAHTEESDWIKGDLRLRGSRDSVSLAALEAFQGSQTSGQAQPKTENPTPGTVKPNPSNTAASDDKNLDQQIDQKVDEAITKAEKQNPDLALVLGIGSLVVDSDVTDYKVQSNVLQSVNVGRATPQFLTGLSFRSKLPNPIRFEACKTQAEREQEAQRHREKEQEKEERQSEKKEKKSRHASQMIVPKVSLNGTAEQNAAGDNKSEDKCQLWEQRPWSFFAGVKFAPNASQVVNGFVFGFSYSIAKHLDVLIGMSLTPINEPAPGFRVAASQFVASEQKQGRDLNFDPAAMLNNKVNAFDGFSIADSTGKLIYSGNPTTVHYHGGAVFGISIPISFKSVLGQ